MPLRNSERKLIGEILIGEGFLQPADLKKGLEIQKGEGGLIGGILVRMGFVSEENLVVALSKQLLIPFLQISNYNVNRNAQKHIPKEIAQKFLLFPFDEVGKSISVAMSDPLNEGAINELEKRTPLKKYIFLATASEIKEAIELYYGEVSSDQRR